MDKDKPELHINFKNVTANKRLASKKQAIKKAKRNQRNIVKKKFSKIERIWAEHGIVRIQNTEGTISNLTPVQAMERCKGLNEMAGHQLSAAKKAKDKHPMSIHAARLEELAGITMHKMRHFMEITKKAASQLENKEGKSEALFELVTGKSLSGEVLNANPKAMEHQIEFYRTKYFTLEEDEIYKILTTNPNNMTMEDRERVMDGEHGNRVLEFRDINMDDLPHLRSKDTK